MKSPLQQEPTAKRMQPLFQQMLDVALVRAWIEESGGKFYERIWTPMVMLWSLVYQRLNTDHSCDAVVSHVAFGGADALDETHDAPLSARLRSEDTGGFCRARKRFPLSVLQQALPHTAQVARDLLGSEGQWLGHPVELVDGTTCSAYPHPDLVEHYGRHSNQHGESYWVVVRVVGTFCPFTGCARDVAEGSMRRSEGALAAEVFGRGTPDTVYVGDRNFGIYSVIQAARHCHSWVVVRMTEPRAKKLAGGKSLRIGEDRVVQWSPSSSDQLHPGMSSEPILGRLLRLQVSRPGFRPVELYLFTTLLDAARYPAAELLKLYGRRYHVELDFRYVKTALSMELFHTKLVDTLRKELWAGLLAYNCIRGFMVKAAKRAKLSPLALSFASCWRRLRDAIAAWCYAGPLGLAQHLVDRLLDRLAQCRLPKREGLRLEPRAVRRRPRTYPALCGSRDDARRLLLQQIAAPAT